MGVRVLGISSSPRAEGNSDLLLAEALAGAQEAGGAVEHLSLRLMRIGPCVSCAACHRNGLCHVEDDYGAVHEKMLAADRIVFATPVYFMAVCAQGKLLIDRCQCLWAQKYVLKRDDAQRRARDLRGMAIAVGGCASRKMFDCIRMTMKYYFDVLHMRYALSLWVNQIDRRGGILRHPAALAEARRLGGLLVTAPPPTGSTPREVLLIRGELDGPSPARSRGG
jgi:multimeric flavodoxin WrbA